MARPQDGVEVGDIGGREGPNSARLGEICTEGGIKKICGGEFKTKKICDGEGSSTFIARFKRPGGVFSACD